MEAFSAKYKQGPVNFKNRPSEFAELIKDDPEMVRLFREAVTEATGTHDNENTNDEGVAGLGSLFKGM